MVANVINQKHGANWALYNADCVQALAGIPDNSIDLSVDSPPFSSLYIYSGSEADMGNARDMREFLTHYEYAVKEAFRVTVPGRLTCVHVKDLPIYKNSSEEEWFGVEDFSGLVSVLHRRNGWVFHSRITIWKDPVIEQGKTNSHGLLHKNFAQRSQVCRVGLPDYLMVFAKPDPESMGKDVLQLRKPGDFIGLNKPEAWEYLGATREVPTYYPGTPEEYNYSIAVWQRYASPVWFDVDQTRVLKGYQKASDGQDEKHICPLQLDVIDRAIDLWSNKGETVLDKFNGVGSTGYEALLMKRRYVGIELKPSYFEMAARKLDEAEMIAAQPTLFDLLPEATP